MLVHPHCKINIGLNITERRPDGYHNLETVFYPIPLRDNLEIKVRENSLLTEQDLPYSLTIGGAPIAGDSADNLVIKAYRLLAQEFKMPAIDVELFKHIPMGAGLGGGSSDAAFMMTALNEMFDLQLTDKELEERVATLGADCAFFVRRQAVYATGIGNIMTNIPLSLKGKYIVLVKPDTFISTKEAYAGVTPKAPIYPLADAIKAPIETWKSTIVNDFEASIFPNHPELAAIKQTLYDMGAIYAAMSGSGSTLFGIFDRPMPEVASVFRTEFTFTKQLYL